jgi:filamentous hemagglutinin
LAKTDVGKWRDSDELIERSLIAELAKAGVKHTAEDILAIVRGPGGRIVFLESGNSRAGLQHIIEGHAADFEARGIARRELVFSLVSAVTRGTQVGTQGTREIFEVELGGKLQYISIEPGSNGFIVSANPTPTALIPKQRGSE